MATRALLGSIQTDAAGNQVLTSTYNHYDGYPENLGVGLNNFYDQTDAAIKISNQGYISYLDPETGEIEAKHKEPDDKNLLPDSYEDAMREVYSIADSYGADYVYLYDFDNMEWLDSRMYGSKKLMDTFSGTGIENQFEGYEGGDLADEDSIRNMEENDYLNEWKSFLTEGNKEMANAKTVLKGKPHLDIYLSSLENDIRLNGHLCDGQTGGVEKPLKPSDFEAKLVNNSKVNLTWSDESDNEESFLVFQPNPHISSVTDHPFIWNTPKSCQVVRLTVSPRVLPRF